MVASKCFCKFSECPNGEPNGTCHLSKGGYCFTYFEEIQEGKIRLIEKRFGCFEPEDESVGTLFQCKGSLSNHYINKNISCCNHRNYCNEDLLTDIQDGQIVFEENFVLFDNLELWFDISALLAVILLLIIIPILYMKFRSQFSCWRKIQKKDEEFNSQKLLIPTLLTPSFKLDSCYEIDQNVPYSLVKTLSTFNDFGSNYTDGSSGGSSSGFYHNNIANNSQNGSNYTIDSNNLNQNSSYFLLSGGSNTTSSFMSEITQQTVLSSQKGNTSSNKSGNENSVTSGSGSGVTRLVQKTIGREIDLKGCIGSGRFGRVLLGVRHCDKYAVKIFFSRHESSWKREVDIHENIIMRHENIVTYFGADIISLNGATQLWLITQFYELGSLYDYLNRRPIETIDQMFSLMKSIIFGLSHLHTEVKGNQGKPIIAHRDIKSKNILMKSETCCCISDFASATTKAQNDAQLSMAHHYSRVGTNRFKAPEILSDSINRNNFEEYLYSDIYSLGLVFWEILNRTKIDNVVNAYSKPYQNDVHEDPSIEEMHQVVCRDKIRPPLKAFHHNQVLFHLTRLIQECWSSNPNARLTSLRIKKTMIDLQVAHSC